MLAALSERRRVLLVDASRRRCDHLELALGRLGLERRCAVRCERAETLAHEPAVRSTADVVTARGFGAPAVTAECAAGLLAVDGLLVVSEPPAGAAAGGERWPSDGLARLGLGPAEHVEAAERSFVRITKVGATEERWPRRVGVPSRRPLW